LSALEPATGPLPLLVYDVLKRLMCAEIDMRHGDFAAANEMLRAARDDIETQGLAFLYPAYVEASGWQQVFGHRYEQARQTTRHLLDVSVLAGNPLLKASAHRLGSLIDYHGRKYALSGAETGHALAIIGCQEPDTLQAVRVLQLQAMAYHHLRKSRAALPLLNRALGYFEATGMPQARAETHLMLALVLHGQDAPACRRHLDRGLALLPQDGFNPFTILSPADLETIGTLAGRDMGGAGRLSSRGEDFPAGPDPAAPASTTVFSTVDWGRAAPGWLDIRTFGGFAVLRDGEHPIPERRWRGSRPKLLLKSLLVHGLREIPKDVVIDNLWPESHPRSAYQNFKVTLHRLRKILEPGLEKNKSSAFIQLKDNLLSLNKARCRVDLESFLTCCKDIKRHAIGGQPDRIAALGHELVTLYQGDFLPEEPYAPWVEMKRWALRDTYFDTILRVCAAHRDLGQPDAAADCCRAALQIDPFQERIIRELIRLYLLVGRQKDARDVFERYRAALKQEMDLEPDAATLALAGTLRRPSTSGD
jgi:DNA-binding SARP family transcriptional activator